MNTVRKSGRRAGSGQVASGRLPCPVKATEQVWGPPAAEVRSGFWRVVVCVTALLGFLTAVAPLQAETVHSRSGQFTVHSPYATTPTLNQLVGPTNGTWVTLAPDFLAVSCERIKSGLLRELELGDQWRGKVDVWIRSRLRSGVPPGLVATRYADGWQYALELPEQIEPAVLVRSVVLTLLTEMANRQAGSRAAEIPYWLVEGLSGRLTGTVGPDLVVVATPLESRLGPAAGRLASGVQTRVGAEDLSEIRAWFLGRTPLTFGELSQPNPVLLTGEGQVSYRRSAELFVYELQGLRHGRRCLQAMVFGLIRSLNWQTAFLRAFSAHFDRLLDVEKWWTLATRGFLQGDQPNSWPRSVSLDKLADLLRVRVDIQDRPGGARRSSEFSLQAFMGQTSWPGHESALRLRLARLQALQRTAAPDTVPLLRSYQAVLDEYLVQRARAGRSGISKRVAAPPPAYVLRETVRRLDELDRQREQMRRLPEVSTVIPAPTPAAR